MMRRLTNYEQETIINFNKDEDIAYIFTYEKTWQKHLEGRLGLKPVMDNGFGGKEYQISKKRIKPPRAPIKFSAETKARMAKRMANMSRSRVLKSRATSQLVKSTTGNIKQG